ncbi:MAG: hypothetical protein KC419_15400 [Anaerolineales bacterium]|nr:hypothetical protein [Anaerolineales bacterium]
MFTNYKRVVYTAVLILFLPAFIGPWTFSQDGVPPPEWCDEQFILIDEHTCARTIPGAEILLFSLFGAPLMLFGDVFTNEQTYVVSEIPRILLLFAISFVILFLPLALSSMRLIPKWRLRQHRFSSIAWGVLLILLLAIMPALYHYRDLSIAGRLWGYGLYVMLTAAMFLAELWGVRQRRMKN